MSALQSSETLVELYRQKADTAARALSWASSDAGKKEIARAVKDNPWYGSDIAIPTFDRLCDACRIAYSHLYLPHSTLRANPADLLSQSARWVIETYLLALRLFRMEFLIYLGRRQLHPVTLGEKSATCYLGLSVNFGLWMTEIFLNVWNGLPDGELPWERIVELDRRFRFSDAHLGLIRSLFESEFGFSYSRHIDSLFRNLHVGVQQERAFLAPIASGQTAMMPKIAQPMTTDVKHFAVDEQFKGVSSDRLQDAVDYIRQKQPIKGESIARHIQVQAVTFRKYYVPVLKGHFSVDNDPRRGGYFIKEE